MTSNDISLTSPKLLLVAVRLLLLPTEHPLIAMLAVNTSASVQSGTRGQRPGTLLLTSRCSR